jgi:hypothetical protein
MFGNLPNAVAQASEPVVLSSGWQLQDAAKVAQAGSSVATATFQPSGWYTATVPGTVLTTLVNNGVYPEPLYGENNRAIPEALNKSSYWYRTTFEVPASYAHRHVWLNFEGINYSAEVWVNGAQVGTMRGAFARGIFDISSVAKPGQRSTLAVLVTPQPHPGVPHEHTLALGLGKNGGETAIDGPTFLSTIGWDWLMAIRDRDTGIWQKVFLSSTGPVRIHEPLVTTDLPLPRTDSADVGVKATLENITDSPQKGTLTGSFGDVRFEKAVEVAPHSSQIVTLDPKTTPALHVQNPKLWWPNGYGPQNLYTLHLSFNQNAEVSDATDVSFGMRKITYSAPDSDALLVSVNGVRVFIRGGDWGLDEAQKRIPRERLEAEIRMHAMANMNMIRNWVGQSTGEDFYELCDKYGILLWDEFFQPNPSDGPNPTDLPTYVANARDKIVRFRNHPSIAIWCARNEGYPPPEIDAALRKLFAELEPERLYQPSSTEGRGVKSGGPYFTRTPREYYVYDEAFKTEIGSVSVPTLESIQGMMPEKDWETINDDWAQHDLAHGAQHGDEYPIMLAARYGKLVNLADFVRKAQLSNYEAFRAMYEGRSAKLFRPETGIITWMSNPAQPSFVWQLYHHDLEPNASLFAVEKAGEPVHIQLNEADGTIQVINTRPVPLADVTASVRVLNLDGSVAGEHSYPVSGPAATAIDLGKLEVPATVSPVYFVQMQLTNATGGVLLARNLYWRGVEQDKLGDLEKLPTVILNARLTRHDSDGKLMLTIVLSNPGKQVALMTHLQLRTSTGERVLPVFYDDNYISLAPGEERYVNIEADPAALKGSTPVVAIDGWNVAVTPSSTADGAVILNTNAQVSHWPQTGLTYQTVTKTYQ